MPVTIVGNNTPTAGGVVYGDGTNYVSTAAGTSGQVLTSNGSSAPTWAAAPGGFTAMQIFTSSGTFTIPAGKTTVKVTVIGGGGGGASQGSCFGNQTGNAGGNSSISSGTQSITTVTGNGGSGGTTSAGTGNTGGTATNGDVNITGGGSSIAARTGGSSLFGFGGNPTNQPNSSGAAGGLYGGGGAGGNTGNLTGGGAGGTAIKYLTGLTPGNTITVTVGAGGTVSNPAGATYNWGGVGAAGVVIFEY